MGATSSTQFPVLLRTPKGTLRGLQLSDADSGRPVYRRYTRIPYALPPVGPLRWQRPHSLPEDFSFSASNGEPGDYTAYGPICPQPVYELGEIFVDSKDATGGSEVENVQSEDCLYLNIWVPAGRDEEMPEGGWPVQFYIHGGWLQIGDAMQNNSTDPFDLLLHTPHPRIIVSPTYRLNIFGFLCSPINSSGPSTPSHSPCPGNFGFWDQRLALEWTHQHIDLFSGNPHNITLGGLSAGAYSVLFQLHYDIYSPHHQKHHQQEGKDSPRLIRRAYLWSNSVGIQPNPSTSPTIHTQFNELKSHFQIPASTSPTTTLSILRTLPASTLVSAIPHLKSHTFRAVTDSTFIPTTFLSSIYSPSEGDFSVRLKRNRVKILLGEVAHEERLYKLVNPAFSREELEVQLRNYYPPDVVEAQLKCYDLPSDGEGVGKREEWQKVYGRIVADAQIHATVRGLTRALLSHSSSSGGKGLGIDDVFRYRISYRPRSLNAFLKAEMGVCHGADAVVWWCSGFRHPIDTTFNGAGEEGSDGKVEEEDEERKKVQGFLEPFGRFIYGGTGDGIGWGTKSEMEVRELDEDGVVRLVEDEGWESGLRVWDMMWRAQSKR